MGRVALVSFLAGFLAVVAYLAAGCGGGASEPRFSNGAAGAREFVEWASRLLDQVPDRYQKLKVTDESRVEWEVEILPYYDYEGLVNDVVPPAGWDQAPVLTGMEHNHVLGWATCGRLTTPLGGGWPTHVHMNLRLANPVSAWYRDADRFLPTLVHEMAHVQGVCDEGGESERAAQDVTVEVLSALANHGNRLVVEPLLEELQYVAMSYVHYEAILADDEASIQEGETVTRNEDAYNAWAQTIVDDPFEWARYEKSQRFWKSTVDRHTRYRGILHDYNWTVWKDLVFSLEGGYTPLLPLPFYAATPGDYRFASKYSGERQFQMDDFAAFLDNAEQMVADLRGRG